MSKVTHYMDCGCALLEDGSRAWCPTCAEGESVAHEPNLELLQRARKTIVGLFYGYPPVDREMTRNLIALMDAVIACQKEGEPSPSVRIKALEECLRRLRDAEAYGVDSDAVHEALLAEADSLLTPPLTCRLCGGPLVDGFCERRCSLLADSSDGPIAESDDGYCILRGQEPDRDFPEEEFSEAELAQIKMDQQAHYEDKEVGNGESEED